MNLHRVLLVGLLSLASMAVGAATIEMHANGLVCAFCAQGIEKKLRKFPATADVVVSLEQRLVAVALKDGQDIPDADLRKALTNAGYTVTTIQRSDTPLGTIRSRVGQAKP
jgi:copper chaperone CopZ